MTTKKDIANQIAFAQTKRAETIARKMLEDGVSIPVICKYTDLSQQQVETLMKKYLTPIEDLISEDFGPVGSPERNQFDMECDAFILGEQLKRNELFHRQLEQVSPAIKMEMDWTVAIIDRIDAIIKRDGLTQRELAKRIGCNETQITRWTKGFPNYTLSSLAKLSVALGEPLIIPGN
jgi:DNA-binding XRE family transcriptional regulator